MNQRPGKYHKAALNDSVKISYRDLVEFCKKAKTDLYDSGDEDAAFRFELLEDWLRTDYNGGSLQYQSKIIGL